MYRSYKSHVLYINHGNLKTLTSQEQIVLFYNRTLYGKFVNRKLNRLCTRRDVWVEDIMRLCCPLVTSRSLIVCFPFLRVLIPLLIRLVIVTSLLGSESPFRKRRQIPLHIFFVILFNDLSLQIYI